MRSEEVYSIGLKLISVCQRLVNVGLVLLVGREEVHRLVAANPPMDSLLSTDGTRSKEGSRFGVQLDEANPPMGNLLSKDGTRSKAGNHLEVQLVPGS